MSDPAPSYPPPRLDYTKALAEGVGVFRRFPLVPVAGIPLMEPIAQQWGPIATFRARPDDLLIATYPKSGQWAGQGAGGVPGSAAPAGCFAGQEEGARGPAPAPDPPSHRNDVDAGDRGPGAVRGG